MSISYSIPVKTISEANQREHWAKRYRRLAGHKRVAMACTLSALSGHRVGSGKVVVTLTRIGAKRMDSDNLAGSCKGVRDGIAKALRIDDGDERISWHYCQGLKGKGDYMVLVNIQWEG